MKVHPYLNFAGQAEEAFNFYKSVFGGEFLANMKMSEIPESDKLSEQEQNLTMHISLQIAKDTVLMASDIMPSAGQVLQAGSQTYIMLTTESREEADRLFKGLSKGGNVEMDMDDMFWGDYFGSFVDKFGIRWMISFNEDQSM
ncbi:VOC family protein [Arenibacter sp. ARW7G5Y1]|uniref:VOC family protein n=1 Tax=Arenibacter sp. ARW7G5Y1 TaxID=2135619 RepID=UPI000D7630CE|nr:VOC family protein [Arenibacter sp. ARW7G5Y1]PXX29869.1 PhnB protein [Arenibacter sp. ARW7G5Y1]